MCVLVENRYYPMFSITSPTHCDNCGSKLHINSHHTRLILSHHGTIACNVTYWICPSGKKSFPDQIIGVSDSANYSSGYYYELRSWLLAYRFFQTFEYLN